jgi:beta-phosphoglucomutase-like phosphatase (HAD superfamily)
MDGVLIDTTDLHYAAWSALMKSYDVDLTWEKFLSTFGMTNPAVLRIFFDNPTPEMIEDLGNRKEIEFRSRVPGNVSVLPGVIHWLGNFRTFGWQQAIVSSAPVENIDLLVDETGIRGEFDVLVSSTNLPSKPDPAVFLEGSRLLAVPPERCIVIEDSPHGVAGAKTAGMLAVAVATTHPLDELQAADLVLDNLSQLKKTDLHKLLGSLGLY